jgi:hypothetical protein
MPGNCTGIVLALAITLLMAGQTTAATAPPIDVDSTNAVDQYTAFASDTLTYDDNVFKIPQALTNISSLLSPNASRRDHIDTISIGTDDQLYSARQFVALKLQLSKNYFDHNKFLDNTSANGSLLWTWQAAGGISGTAGADYLRQLANSSQTLFYGKDLVGIANEYVDARYQIGSRWDVFGGVHANETTNSAVELHIDNFHSKTANSGLEYVLRDSDTVGIEYSYANARAVQNFVDVRFNGENYNEDRAHLLLHYALDGKTQLDATVGYLKRYYPETNVGDFSGDVWRVSLGWQPTEKVELNVSTWRDLAAYLDAESNYFVARGENVSPIWVASEKLSFSISAQWVRQDYIASSPTFLTIGERHDTLHSQQVSVIYTPVQWLTFTFAYDHEGHSSTIEFFTYGDRLWTGTLRVTF